MFSSLDIFPGFYHKNQNKTNQNGEAAQQHQIWDWMCTCRCFRRSSAEAANVLSYQNNQSTSSNQTASNQKSKVCNASWKLLAERPFHSTSGLWAWYTFSICVRGSKAVCKSIINAAAATEEPAVLLHVDENVTIKVSCLYLCLIFNLSIVWCFYSGRKYSVTNPHRSMEWFWFWFWSDGPRVTQAAAVDDRHAAARPASGPVGYLPALTEVTWWLTPAGEIDMFVVRLCWIVVICWTVSVRSAAARSSGSRQLDSFFMRLETRAALIHDGCKSASVSRGRITERPHVFASWRLTSAMIPSPFIQPQSHTWSCGNIFVVLFQSDRMKWFDLDIC